MSSKSIDNEQSQNIKGQAFYLCVSNTFFMFDNRFIERNKHIPIWFAIVGLALA